MSISFFTMLFAMLVCLSYAQGSIPAFNSQSHFSNVKCIETERQALLNFKHGIIDDHGMLSTWRDDDNSTDCCSWEGIQCNNQTGHILMLHLHGQYQQRLRGAINITSLIHLQNIQHLNLSNNDFRGRIPYELGNLSKLEYLDLSENHLDGEIPYQLGNLSHLRYLDLRYNPLNGTIPSQLGNLSQLRYLDLTNSLNGTIPSQLGKLTSLRYLHLCCNRLHGEIPYQLGNLSQLRYLDLGMNYLDGIIPSQLGNLTSLRYLRLGGINDVLKTNNAKWLSSFTSLTTLDLSLLHDVGSSRHWLQFINEIIPNLRELYLSDCNLSDDDISHSNLSTSLSVLDLSSNMMKSSAIFNWISNFTNLHSLYLDRNLLECFIPDGFGKAMNSLEFLTVENNNLQGEIPTSLGNISTLQELDLSNNNLSGEMFSFIQNSSCSNRMTGMLPNLSTFTSLWYLDLSNNQLTGEIPRGIGLLYELEYLLLQGNHLEGHINELHLTNLSKLEGLDLSDNSLLSLKFGPTWVPPFQLIELGLASCKLGPSFPSWLQSQSHLSFLDISDAGIDDFVPEWFWNKLQTIGQMNMSYNSLKGTIPNLPLNLTYGDYNIIILNSNQFEGGIPAFFSQVATLDLSKNKISDLNTLLCRKRATIRLLTLDLSNNQIMGQLPDCWEHLTSLKFLDLRNNNLSGKIPQSMGSLVNLEALVLRNNRLTGDIPFQLKNCTYLQILDVSENLLSGPIPSWIGESLQQLKILSLRVNGFFGSIPVYLCYLSQIQVLDLSRNNLAGRIPTCLRNFSAMTERSVNAREIVRTRKLSSQGAYLLIYNSDVLLMWKGQEQVFLNPDIFLKSIDLSSNDLRGDIPKEVGCLLGLVSLNLARNSLNGEIPPEIGNLNQLDFLDLSRNHFSGRIPSTLSKIDGLGYLNLSNNDLSGRIPWEGHLQDFDASSFEENIGLCGQQLNKSCPGDYTGVQPQGHAVHGEDDNSIFYEALYMSLGLGFFIGFWGLLGPILLWKPWRNAYGRFLNILTDYILVTIEENVTKCHGWLRG